jgi:DNA polymerase-4
MDARRIIHIDMDAFYASVEQRDDPDLRCKPVAVGGSPQSRGVVAAASYEAREFGVRSAMPMARAVRLCPQLLIVPPDFARYKAASQGVMAILRSATPLVEPLSLDEAYLDVTENLWNEPLATAVAKKIKQRIVEELGLTASAGVAPNKFLAKIASGWRKPDGLTVIAPERVERFLQGLPVDALWGVGPVTAGKLRAAGIEKLVDVRTADPQTLKSAVGSYAEALRRMSFGDDPREVNPHSERKSIGCENTFAEDLKDIEEIRREVDTLARQTARALARRKLFARTITLKLRYSDFETITRSHTEDPPTCSAEGIVSRATALLEKTAAGRRPVRLLGVTAHGLSETDTEDAPASPGRTEDELPFSEPSPAAPADGNG